MNPWGAVLSCLLINLFRTRLLPKFPARKLLVHLKKKNKHQKKKMYRLGKIKKAKMKDTTFRLIVKLKNKLGHAICQGFNTIHLSELVY